jgi:hypothetical protein
MIENLLKYDEEVVKKHFSKAPDTGLGHYKPAIVDKDYSVEFIQLINKITDNQSVELGKFLGADGREMTPELFKEKINFILKEVKDLDKVQVALLSFLKETYIKDK